MTTFNDYFQYRFKEQFQKGVVDNLKKLTFE